MRSKAVKRVCLRDETNTKTGLSGECCLIAYCKSHFNKNKVYFAGCVVLKSYFYLKCRLIHCSHTWAVMFPWETRNVHLQRNRADGRAEVEESDLADIKPIGEIPSIGHRCRETDKAKSPSSMRCDKVGTRNNHFQNGTSILTE